ncbi:chemotaxis protein CheA [Desulfosporosinus sp. FKA]|uniref:chemotaxis protein CheA n=1 Tax=Desulfosporosinus sp. FKA TaxID=1969834 RepID=UPI001FA837A9|nr:chemotaxis protein CheA [Desulfosporosinus sp. FKA]
MNQDSINEPLLELYLYETVQFLEQMEQIVLVNEKASSYPKDDIDEIFRIMHTIKGSSAMMLFTDISSVAHAIEDLFFCLREDDPQNVNYEKLSDLVLDGLDYIKLEIAKIKNGYEADGDASELINKVQAFLAAIKDQKHILPTSQPRLQNTDELSSDSKVLNDSFQVSIYFEDGCGMENLRAFGVINDLEGIAHEIEHIPEDLDADASSKVIREQGLNVRFKSNRSCEEIHQLFSQTLFLQDFHLDQLDDLNHDKENDGGQLNESPVGADNQDLRPKEHGEKEISSLSQPSIISVNVAKLDKLMDLVGEMVIAEAMVTQNPDLKGLDLKNFDKAARQLRKITSDLQDIVMSVRMVPLSGTFRKMNRPLRDMCKKLGKEVQLQFIGEETEVDKNIIEHISDPLMHLIRNSIDHGIETPNQRESEGKPRVGTIVLEAQNAGGDVLVIVRDDGRGFNKEKILEKARERQLLLKSESEYSVREIYNLVFLPGFSTSEEITEFSGRGVGMDVVVNNIESIGGSISADSIPGKGTTITLKIPLTLAIIDGMNIKVGDSRYTIPLTVIKESFRPKSTDLIEDPDHNEMIMVRGQCFPIIRLHELYHVKTKITNFTDGILIMLEQDKQTFCIFADELLGQQQVVVKALPAYIRRLKKVKGLAGCTLLGDGSISLILDIAGLAG